MTMASRTPCILTSTSSSRLSSSPGSMKSAMLSLEWKRLRAACMRSRIFTDTGVPSSRAAVVSWLDGSAFMSILDFNTEGFHGHWTLQSQQAFQVFEGIGLVQGFVVPDPQHSWKAHGDAALVAAAAVDAVESQLEHQARLDAAHRAEFLDGVLADDRVDLAELL